MAGLRGRDGQRDGLQIAHFADHDDIRIFAQRAAQRGAERFGMGVHFALVHLAALRCEEIFDRILQGDDVIVARAVHLLDQRGKRRALAAADRTRDQNQPVLELGEKLELRRKPKLIHRPHIGLDDAEDQIVTQPVPHHACAVAAVFVGIGKVHITPLLEQFFLGFIEKTQGQALGVRRSELVRLQPDRLERPEAAPRRPQVDAQMDVRCAGLLADGQVLVHMVQHMDGRRILLDDFDDALFRGGRHSVDAKVSTACAPSANSKEEEPVAPRQPAEI